MIHPTTHSFLSKEYFFGKICSILLRTYKLYLLTQKVTHFFIFGEN